MNTQIITPQDWTKFKNQILQNQAVKKQVGIHEIDILSENKIGYNGAEIPLSKEAANDLRSVLNLPVQFSKDINKTFGDEAKKRIIEMCRMMRVAGGKSPNVTLVIDPKARQIIRIVREDRMLSMETFFDTFESLMNTHNLDIRDYHQSADGGVNINVVSQKGEFQVGNFADEIFHPGMTFKNNMRDGSFIMPFMYRLVCTNGMNLPSFGAVTGSDKTTGPIQLGGEDFKSMDLFYKHIDHFVKGGFYPDQFKAKIQLAMNTSANDAKVEQAGRLICDNSNAKIETIGNFVPVADIRSQYKAFGVANPEKLPVDKQKTSRTNITIWDVVNGITDFASHDYGFEISADQRLRMQVSAGSTLDKGFDTQNLMDIHLPKK